MTLVEKFIAKYGRLPTEFDKDYLEMLRMSKYRILPIPDFKPGVCANCGSAKTGDRQYIDFGLEIDWHGIIYLCSLCLKDIATELGLFQSYTDEISRLTDSLLKLKKTDKQGVDLRKDFLKIFKEVQDYFTTLPVVSDDPVVNNSPPVANSTTVETEPTLDAIKSAVDAAKSRALKPPPVSRPKNFSSLAELLESNTE